MKTFNRTLQKKAHKGLPQKPTQSRLLHHKVAILEAKISRLEESIDTNVSVFTDSLKMLEAMNIVQQRVANDILNGVVRCFGDAESDNNGMKYHLPIRSNLYSEIDFNGYMREYWLCLMMADFVQWLVQLNPEKPLVERVSSMDVIEFGG